MNKESMKIDHFSNITLLKKFNKVGKVHEFGLKIKLLPVICDELFHKFIHRCERSKFASSMYPLQCLGNDFENI